MCGRSNYTPNLVCKLPLLLLISSARLPVMQPAPFPRPAHPNLYKKEDSIPGFPFFFFQKMNNNDLREENDDEAI